MNANSKNVLYIDLLNQSYKLKAHKNLNDFLGGVGIGLKLLQDNLEKNPVILSSGPLSGLFPYASKLSLICKNDKDEVEELYGGGSFAAKMQLANIDSIVIYNKPKNPLVAAIGRGKVSFSSASGFFKYSISGKESSIKFSGKTLIDNYFGFGKSVNIKNLKGLIISGEGEIKIPNKRTYNEIYNKVLDKKAELFVKYAGYPSCWGCPAGCSFSNKGETDNAAVLPRCLVSCEFAESVYKEIPLVFTCLTVLGLKYNHEHLERIPDLVGSLKRELKMQ